MLFQGTFKAVKIEQQEHFLYIPYYIHLNPLDLIEPEWKNGKMRDLQKAIDFLDSYKWSSHLDYIGKKNFPSVIQTEFLNQLFETPENYKKEILDWLQNAKIAEIEPIIMDEV